METRIEKGKLICTNVIQKEEFKILTDKMLSDHFPWYYSEHVVEDAQKMTEEKSNRQKTKTSEKINKTKAKADFSLAKVT